MKIRFASFNALVVYQSMAEGMSEVREADEDGGKREARELDELIKVTGERAPLTSGG
jgi:hypothetical protein